MATRSMAKRSPSPPLMLLPPARALSSANHLTMAPPMPSPRRRTAGLRGSRPIRAAIPAAMPPGLGVSLTLKEGGQQSNTVAVALQ